MRLPDWLGFRGKTLWDWLQLLIVPAILIGVTFAWSATQTRTDDMREDRRSQDATLQAYLNQMSDLMLDRKLLKSKKDDAVRAVARTVTLTALRRLDAERKAEVVHFLYEAGVLHVPHDLTFFGSVFRGTPIPIVDLEGADLRGVDLANASLWTTECGVLEGVRSRALLKGDFRGARFDHATLCAVDLSEADLRGASFAGAKISHTTLSFADKLEGASFKGASFWHVDLACADLDGVVFDDADIGPGTTFEQAHLDSTSFVRARFNVLAVPFHGKTSFVEAEGRGVDFSHAENLSTLDVRDAAFPDVRLDGAEERPPGWGPTGPPHPEKPRSREIAAC